MNIGKVDDVPMRIVLFFTHGVSLALWEKRGVFSREVRFYQALAEHVGEVWFFTYGRGDGVYQERLGPFIKVFPKRLKLPNILYGIILSFVYARQIKRASIIRTHQMAGAIPALIACWIMRKPLIVRCGYQWSKFLHGQSAPRLKQGIVWLLELCMYRAAQKIIVTTESHARYIAQQYQLQRKKIYVIPNYIDTELFRPLDITKIKKSLCFVGRLEQEKNLLNLVTALEGMDIQLFFFGDGSLKNELKELADKKNVSLVIRNLIPNNRLPQELNQCELFILPSFHEGNPKSLLEAMACGLPVIGTDVEGIREIVDNGKNGLLCGTDVESIRSAIKKLLSMPGEQHRLGEAARQTICSAYSLSKIITKEIDALRTFTV